MILKIKFYVQDKAGLLTPLWLWNIERHRSKAADNLSRR